MVWMAETMRTGGDSMVDLDYQRDDGAGAALRAVAEILASPTFIGRTKRFEEKLLSGIVEPTGELRRGWFALVGDKRRGELAGCRPSIDLDPTDVEEYSWMRLGVACNHAGSREARPHPAILAEAGVCFAADLGSGTSDARP